MLLIVTGQVAGCVDQPLIPVEQPSAKGGSAPKGSDSGGSFTGTSSNSGGFGGTSGRGGGSGAGGWFGSGGNGPNPSGGQSNECISKVGVFCGPGNECCGDKGLTCGADSTCCKNDNQSCRNNAECCHGACINEVCATPAGKGCVAADFKTRCTDPTDCCSGKCEFAGGANKVCFAIEGCKPIGETCQYWFDCCSEYCSISSSGGTGKCQRKASSMCRQVGDLCFSENMQDECCADGICKKGPEGVLRCKRRNQGGCDIGNACSVASDCCAIGLDSTGHCIERTVPPDGWDPSGNFGTCQLCGDAGQACKAHIDCCTSQGYQCQMGTSVQVTTGTTTACLGPNATCVSSNGSNGGTAGAGSSSACCTGLVCDGPTSKCVQR